MLCNKVTAVCIKYVMSAVWDLKQVTFLIYALRNASASSSWL